MGCRQSRVTTEDKKVEKFRNISLGLSNRKWWILIIMIVIIAILAYLIFNRMNKPQFVIPLDLASLGLPEGALDLSLFNK